MNRSRRTLSIRLKEVNSTNGVDIFFNSIDKNETLSTIDETFESSFTDFDEVEEEEKSIDAENDEVCYTKNKLFDSLPSMEWAETVDKIIVSSSTSRRRRLRYTPPSYIRKALDRRYNKETASEAFEQLRLLDELSTIENYKKNTVCLEKRIVLRARESQLRRRIFKLQRDNESLPAA